jgi:hypothetical protein
MKNRTLVLLENNERALIVSNRLNNTFIVRTKKGKYKVVTKEDIKTILRY